MLSTATIPFHHGPRRLKDDFDGMGLRLLGMRSRLGNDGGFPKSYKESKHLGETRRRVMMARLRESICSVGAKDMGAE